MKKKKKGEYGYLNYMRVFSVFKSFIMFAVSFGVFFIGYYNTGKKENIITVVAVLGLLPACKWLVNAIMFLRFKTGAAEFYNKSVMTMKDSINNERGVDATDGFENLKYACFYDSVLTIENGGSYPVNMFFCFDGTLIGYSDYKKMDCKLVEKHIKDIFKNNGIKGIGIKIFVDEKVFLQRLSDLIMKASDNDNYSREITEKELSARALIGEISL